MGQSLDAEVVYGFILDKHLEISELPTTFLSSLTVEEVCDLTYSSVEYLSATDYIEALIKKRFTTLDMGYPGTEDCEEMSIYVKRTELNAYYGSEPLTLEDANKEEQDHINEIASLFSKEPHWLFYPTYG